MPRFLPVIAAFLIIWAGCASVEETNYFEAEDLMAVQHNEYNDYILLVYRDPLGQTRHVLRRYGITEIVLTYTIEGEIVLKARGKKERVIEPTEAGHITQRINGLLHAKEHGQTRIAST
ncbi:MAG: hypothetical protein KTR29_03185 [Rhodothermaceae bacterium]|nr:hypothetical protein [Rhodothermaceae bacterium]